MECLGVGDFKVLVGVLIGNTGVCWCLIKIWWSLLGYWWRALVFIIYFYCLLENVGACWVFVWRMLFEEDRWWILSFNREHLVFCWCLLGICWFLLGFCWRTLVFIWDLLENVGLLGFSADCCCLVFVVRLRTLMVLGLWWWELFDSKCWGLMWNIWYIVYIVFNIFIWLIIVIVFFIWYVIYSIYSCMCCVENI